MKVIVFGASAVVVLALTFLFSPFVIVNAGHRGVVLNLGKVSDSVLGEGIHWRTPFVQSVKELPVRIVKLEVTAPAYSKDTQVVDTIIALNYHLVPDSVNVLYREIGTDWEEVIIQPAIQESVKTAIARYTAQELTDLRPQVTAEIKALITERLSTKYMSVDEFSVNDFAFSDDYERAVERKQVAKQDALTAEAKLEQVEFEAQQKIESSRAEAEAIRIQAQAITQQGGEDYVNLKAIEKWNGILPTQFVPGSAVPFINI